MGNIPFLRRDDTNASCHDAAKEPISAGDQPTFLHYMSYRAAVSFFFFFSDAKNYGVDAASS